MSLHIKTPCRYNYVFFSRGEIQSCHLGCAIECWDADLNSAVPVDEPGELVCTKPFPSMPVRFWNDPEFQLYRAAYFDKIPGRFCIDNRPTQLFNCKWNSSGIDGCQVMKYQSSQSYKV